MDSLRCRDSFLLAWLIAHLGTLLPGAHKDESIADFQRFHQQADASIRAQFKIFMTDFFAEESMPLSMRIAGKVQSIDSSVLYPLLKDPGLIIINVVSEKIFLFGEEKSLTKSPLQWRILAYLATHHGSNISKAELAQAILDRPSYKPQRDDNSIYVAINRIRTFFGDKEIIQHRDGNYSLSTAAHIVVITKASSTDASPSQKISG